MHVWTGAGFHMSVGVWLLSEQQRGFGYVSHLEKHASPVRLKLATIIFASFCCLKLVINLDYIQETWKEALSPYRRNEELRTFFYDLP